MIRYKSGKVQNGQTTVGSELYALSGFQYKLLDSHPDLSFEVARRRPSDTLALILTKDTAKQKPRQLTRGSY